MILFNGNIQISSLEDVAKYYISKPTNEQLTNFVSNSYQFSQLSNEYSEEVSELINKIFIEIEKVIDQYLIKIEIDNLKYEEAFLFAGSLLGRFFEEYNVYELISKYFKEYNDIKRIDYLTDAIFFRQLGKLALKANNFKVATFYNSWALGHLSSGWTPYNNFSPVEKKYLRMKALAIPLIKKIWELDKENLLFGIQVARIVVELLPNEKLTETQIKELIKTNELTPTEIILRDEKKDYGNTIQERKARKELIASIKIQLKSYCDELLLLTP